MKATKELRQRAREARELIERYVGLAKDLNASAAALAQGLRAFREMAAKLGRLSGMRELEGSRLRLDLVHALAMLAKEAIPDLPLAIPPGQRRSISEIAEAHAANVRGWCAEVLEDERGAGGTAK